MDMFRRMVGDLGASLMALEGAEGVAAAAARNGGGGGGPGDAAGALAVLRGQVASFRTVLRYLSLVNDEVPRCAGRRGRRDRRGRAFEQGLVLVARGGHGRALGPHAKHWAGRLHSSSGRAYVALGV